MKTKEVLRSMTNKSFIQLDSKKGIAKITLNRPEHLNALNPEMLKELLTT